MANFLLKYFEEKSLFYRKINMGFTLYKFLCLDTTFYNNVLGKLTLAEKFTYFGLKNLMKTKSNLLKDFDYIFVPVHLH